MKLNRKTEYALKALIELAINYDKGVNVMLINSIAERENIPPRYLEQILLSLKNSGILVSKRGVGGGYTLSRAPEEISLGDVIRVVEGPVSPLSYATAGSSNDTDELSCGLYSVMEEVGKAITNMLDNISLKDITNRALDLIEEKKSVLNYAI